MPLRSTSCLSNCCPSHSRLTNHTCPSDGGRGVWGVGVLLCVGGQRAQCCAVLSVRPHEMWNGCGVNCLVVV